MPTQSRTKEKIYLLIMVFCLLMCAVLLISVFCDVPLVAIKPLEDVHVPAMRLRDAPSAGPKVTGSPGAPAASPALTELGAEITQEYLMQQMQSYIPKSFPAEAVAVEILGRGGFEIELQVQKDDLKRYLEECDADMDIKQRLAMGMFPEQMEIEAVLLCAVSPEQGIELEAETLSINDREVEPELLPQNLFEVLSGAIRSALTYSGHTWNALSFGDGVVYLK